MNKIIKILSFALAVLLLCSCTAHNPGGAGKDEFYIKINENSLSKEYIGYFFYVAQLNMIKEAGMVLGEGGNSTDEDVALFWETTEIEGKSAVSVARDLAADNAVIQTVQYLKAKEEGIALSDTEEEQITSQINATIESNGGEEAFDKLLKSMGCDSASYRQILTENKFVEKLYNEYNNSGKLDITNDELSAYSVDLEPEIVLDMAKKDKFNQMAQQWKNEYDIIISDEKMNEFDIKKD